MSTHGTDSKTKFFHAMVLMGGSLALGCGGLAEKPGSDNTADTGGSGGTSGTGGSGGTVGSGGLVGSGGSAVGSGGLVIGSGGIASGGSDPGPIEPGPFACPPAQWECDINASACGGIGYALPDDCPCNSAGPLSPSDCQAGEWLVCLNGTHNAQGQSFTRSVPFNCQCLPAEDCETACAKMGASYAECGAVSAEDPTILCGCAVVILR